MDRLGAVGPQARSAVMPGWAVAVVIAGGTGALARRGLDELGDAAPVDADALKDAARDALRSRG